MFAVNMESSIPVIRKIIEFIISIAYRSGVLNRNASMSKTITVTSDSPAILSGVSRKITGKIVWVIKKNTAFLSLHKNTPVIIEEADRKSI